MSNILNKIIAHKIKEIEQAYQQQSLKMLSEKIAEAPPIRDFREALVQKITRNIPAIIAEIKKASPSKGILRENFDVAEIALSYSQNQAACLSILTDEQFFQGHLNNLNIARSVCDLPILRKDFIIDPYQVYQARVYGADAILLIVAALGDTTLKELALLAYELEMEVLFEIHDQAELERVLALNPRLLGINNRNLQTFETTLQTTLDLLPNIPADILLVTESGIHVSADIQMMWQHGVKSFLIGEAFMKADNPGQQLMSLIGGIK